MYSVNTAAALMALSIFQGVHAALEVTKSSNVAIYWGQNSYGDSSGDLAQQDLAYYCESSDIDVIQLAFLDVINGEGGAPEINFANSGDSCTTFDGTALLDCPTIAEDIVTCQSLGKTILLSIGGSTYSEGGFTSEDAAIAGAKMIWETFGPVSTNTSINRPFGNSVVDGFDFDFESSVDNMPSFANELRSLFAEDTSKTYYLTAAPQCVYPDAADNPMLDGAVYFDAIWVQFYNNYCGVNYFTADSTTQANFNFVSWNTWATTISLNPNVKVFLGIPGGSTAAGTGYESASTIASIIDFILEEGYTSFGGVMMWDASQVYANDGFLSSIASALGSSSTSTTNSTGISTTHTSTTTKATTLSIGTKTSASTTLSSASTTSTAIETSRPPETTLAPTTTAPTTLSTVQKTGTVTVKTTKTVVSMITTNVKPVVPTTSTSTIATITTAVSATATATSLTADVSSEICPVLGGACATSGTYSCNGSSYGICDNGEWAIQKCASGLVCVQDETFIYCDFKGDHPDTTCS
ncbi:hypothetical protein N7520_005547 [Penicillium odoratum]|uniref:uncharacterized protein n=1 Tax=Penicillium odoratum TaxID=1167516 RepID=UPI0025497249|nr:uncharacterized protein N7520_005547 [Penicillium odoratum]KAJ5758391.1 hypothetical protein N7520_005547 [Penicillium odoratum]